ncbi:autotransporter domain-containing protein [Sansalvadorimonas sp. 2012CJ34-2]|uniref:Autotransporter domain-containing protein n=1 Tax=Parendozoicomonas callyspongiae TaxID=2942213 RepID=A0ABT0PD76_9GAMM|nr:autotransporter outer membrane beta-barrel domain-containing protein [Sansalvadorimonas sp. 2012CJ34-2]MCL6269290.1 autotransporter domain-containing protein [Sansalvadorimonas sp. 2012CJ34-2]
MPRNGFRKATLAVAITAISFGAASSASAAALVVTGSQTYVRDVTGTSGPEPVFSLEKSGSFFSSSCHNSSHSCTFTNSANINLGGALSVFRLGSGAYYKIDNNGVLNADGGVLISADSTAGKRLHVTNRGTITAATAINYNVVGGALTLGLEDGSMSGTINLYDDSARDYIFLTGGSYSGTVNNIDIVRALKNASSISGELEFASAGTITRQLEVLSGASLFTDDLEVRDAPLNLRENAELRVGVSNSSTGPIITMHTHNANLSNGKVVIVPDRSFTTATVSVISKVDANTVTAASNIVVASELYDLGTPSASNGGTLSVTVTRNSSLPEDIIRNGGGSENASKAYKSATLSPNTTLYKAVASKVGLANTVEFAEELAPTTNGGAIALAQDAQDLSHQNIAKRLNTISPGSGMNAGSLLDGKTLWVQGLYGEGEQDDRKRSDDTTLRGYTSRISGFTMGMDMELGHDLMAGAAISVGQASVNKNEVRDNTEMDTYMATLYGRWYVDPESDTNLDVFLSYGLHKNSRERFFDVENAVLNEATSDFDSKQYGIKAVLSQTVMFHEWAVTPLVGLHYGRFDIDAYKEKGSAAALEMGKQRYEIIEAGLGVGVSRSFQYNETEVIPEVKVSGWHDFSGEGVEVQSRFVSGGDTFVAKGIDPEKTTWTASAGVTFVEDERFEMTTGYERNWRKGFHSDNVYVRAEYKF